MPKKCRLILDEWEKFEGMVVPKDAPPLQLQEMNLSFYAGALAMLRIITASGGNEQFEKMMEDVNDELHENYDMHISRLTAGIG